MHRPPRLHAEGTEEMRRGLAGFVAALLVMGGVGFVASGGFAQQGSKGSLKVVGGTPNNPKPPCEFDVVFNKFDLPATVQALTIATQPGGAQFFADPGVPFSITSDGFARPVNLTGLIPPGTQNAKVTATVTSQGGSPFTKTKVFDPGSCPAGQPTTPTGSLDVVKQVTGAAATGSEQFAFDVDCTDDTADQQFTMGAGTKTVSGIAENATCTVTETDDDGADSTTVVPAGGQVTIAANQTQTVTFTNDFPAAQAGGGGGGQVPPPGPTTTTTAGSQTQPEAEVAGETVEREPEPQPQAEPSEPAEPEEAQPRFTG